MNFVRRLLVEEEAATAVEYAVVMALILAACLGTIAAVGSVAREMWDLNSTTINTALGGASGASGS